LLPGCLGKSTQPHCFSLLPCISRRICKPSLLCFRCELVRGRFSLVSSELKPRSPIPMRGGASQQGGWSKGPMET
jgi:hypothetical protein